MVLSKPNRVLISALSCFGSVIGMDAEEAKRNKWREGHQLKCGSNCERYRIDATKNFTKEQAGEAFEIEEAFVTWHNAFVTHKNPKILTIKPIGVGEKMNGFFGPKCKYYVCTNEDCCYYSEHDTFHKGSYHFAVLNKSLSSPLIDADVYCECEAFLQPVIPPNASPEEKAEIVSLKEDLKEQREAAKELEEEQRKEKQLEEEAVQEQQKKAAAKRQQVAREREEPVITKTVHTIPATEVKQPTETIKKIAKALNITDVGGDVLSQASENFLKDDLLVRALFVRGCMDGEYGGKGINAPRLKADLPKGITLENAFTGKLRTKCLAAFKSHRRRLPVMERLLQEIRELNQK